MEKRPPSSKPGPNKNRPGPGGEKNDARADGEHTPLPMEDADDWANLGATRVVEGNIAAANTEVRAEDTALPLSSDLAEKTQLGDFQLVKKLGEGAMGVVFLANQMNFSPPRQVALKILFKHVASNQKLVERMKREARAMFELEHPNIVSGYGWDEVQGYHFVVMEYVNGTSLQKWLGKVGRLNLGDALHVIIACARALQYAHDQKLVHRDIKPDNILIGRKGEIKVADLGMAKVLDEDMSLTQTGHAVGTPWYMPLEQARNAKETDGRCDIYALGCMLYCLITGQPPFTGHTLVEVIEAKEKGTFPPARKANADVPERLDLIIAKMTAKLVNNRYQSCADVVKDLESLGLANEKLEFVSNSGSQPGTATPGKIIPSTMERTTVQPGSDEAKTTEYWYLRFRNSEGQVIQRRLSAAQVTALVTSPNFDPTAQISRQPREGFRALGTYKEFENLVIGKLSKKAADQNTVRYRNLYKKIEEQERKKEKPEEKPVSTQSYWLGIFFQVAGVCAGVGFLIWLLWYFATGLGR